MKPTKEEFVEYYLGHTNKETEWHFNITARNVKSLKIEYDCYKRNRKCDLPDKNEFIELFRNSTAKELEKHYKVSYDVISRWREELMVERKICK